MAEEVRRDLAGLAAEYQARLRAGSTKATWSSSEAAQRALDAARIKLTPKEREVYLRTRRNNNTLTAKDLDTTEEVLLTIEGKGWISGDYDPWARVRRYWRLPNWDDDALEGNGYAPR